MALSPNARLRVAVLGPVLVEGRAGSLVEPTGVLGKSLIVALALARGTALSVAALIEDLWGDEPPRQAKAALQTLVSRVRGECADGLLLSANGGYSLSVGRSEIDLWVATELRDEARTSVSLGDHDAAQTHSGAALALWRGEPGVELAPAPSAELCARAAALRSELQRIGARARIELGQPAEAVAELQSLVAASPLDEELHSLLMRALAASGRTADALAVFARFRTALRDELGASPSGRIVQLNSTLLRDGDAPVMPAHRVRIGLRTPPNHLLGRESDLAALGELIRSSRLTTILGPGGLGKTRLAQELGLRASAHTPAVIVVELASVRSGEDVTLALGSTFGIREASGSLKLSDPGVRLDVRERILSVLGERETLLIIDNCEHIVDAAAAWIADILASTTSVRILATSRSPLAISGESVYQLDSLASDDGAGGLGPASTLFIERAIAARPGAALPHEAIARLCARLDGLPLAIELAAARVRSMPIDEIERRLSNRFALLTGGERTAPERHRTLMAVIDWSWNLLTDSERVLLRRLSRFPDGFSAEAAQGVGAGNDGEDVANALDGLVNQSLVSVSEDPATGHMRYRMLETVREFGDMALVDAGEDAQVRVAMAAWAHSFATELMGQLENSDQIRTFRILGSEQDNLIMVLRAAIDDGDADSVVTVFATLAYYWSMRGAHSDITTFGGSILRATKHYVPDAAHLTAAIATYSIVAGSSLFGDVRTGLLARGRLRTVRRIGASSDPRIDAMSNLVLLTLAEPRAIEAHLAVYRESPNAGLAALSALLSAQLEENEGNLTHATTLSRHAYDLAGRTGDVWLQATAAQALSNLYSQRGDPDRAIEWADRSMRGHSALEANADLQQLSWLIAMAELSRSPERSLPVFEGFIAESDENLGDDFVDLRSIGWAGLAEIALLEGRIDDGLEFYRNSVRVFGPGRGRMSPWHNILSASCISAYVFAVSPDQAFVRSLARRTRSRFLAMARLRPEFIDMPVSGAAIVGLSAWMLSPTVDASGAERTVGLRLLLLGEAMGGRQDLPSLNHARHTDAAVADYGQAAVDAARASVAGLTPRQAMDLACELLKDRTLRELFAKERVE